MRSGSRKSDLTYSSETACLKRIDLCAQLQGMYGMGKKYMTFKHWKTGEIKTIEFREADVPANPNSERLVVWNETEQKLEDVIKSTIVEIREE